MENLGLLFIPTSGHTLLQVSTLTKSSANLRDIGKETERDIFVNVLFKENGRGRETGYKNLEENRIREKVVLKRDLRRRKNFLRPAAACSVTRFGEILDSWAKNKSRGQILKGLFTQHLYNFSIDFVRI